MLMLKMSLKQANMFKVFSNNYFSVIYCSCSVYITTAVFSYRMKSAQYKANIEAGPVDTVKKQNKHEVMSSLHNIQISDFSTDC